MAVQPGYMAAPPAGGKARHDPNYGNGIHVIRDRPDSRLVPMRVVRRLLEIFRSPDYRPPVLPTVALELMALSRKADAPMPQVMALVQKEPLVAAAVLRLAQSAAYSRGEPVASLHQAAVRLGMRTLADLFLQAALTARVFRAPGYDEPMDRLRRHSAAVAAMARSVCRRTPFDDENAFMCGLLHDAGAVACLIALSESWGDRARPTFQEAWPAVVEVHEMAGGELARIWGLPEEVKLVVAHHHRFVIGGHPHPLAATVCVADALVAEAGLGMGMESHGDPAGVGQRMLGLTAQTMEVLKKEAAEIVAGTA